MVSLQTASYLCTTGGSSHGYTTRASFSGVGPSDRESITGIAGTVTLRRTMSNMGFGGGGGGFGGSGSTHGSSNSLNSSAHGDSSGGGAGKCLYSAFFGSKLIILYVHTSFSSSSSLSPLFSPLSPLPLYLLPGLGDTIFASALRGVGGTLDMNAFAECLKQPEQHLGLSLSLFTCYMRLRLALLEYEYRSTARGGGGWESSALVHITAQTQRIHEHCAAALHKAGLGDAGPTEANVDAILLSGKAFLRQLSKHLAGLCGVERGAFELARRCRDVKVQVEGYLNDLSPEYTSRASFSYSMSGRASFSGGGVTGNSPRS